MRTSLPAIETDPVTGQLKLNPLGRLVAGRYPALSAAAPAAAAPVAGTRLSLDRLRPCTRAVKDGEDIRAGRWWQLDKTECGIHRGEGI